MEAGAEYAITQPVFDPDQLLSFSEELKKRGIWIPIVAGIWPLVSARNAEFMANEVPGVVVPPEIVRRMHRASAKSREHALQEGITIAREMFERVRTDVQGLQVSAPFGRVQFALQVFDGLPGIRTDIAEEAALAADTLGFPPPVRRTSAAAAADPRAAGAPIIPAAG
ncbi:MAG TPA: methylenetetrahydrofolate reductase [Longimicrobiales bacterium]|nr:methylenetetrahydrofolate reductase [Longimicrobiales bacterium]